MQRSWALVPAVVLAVVASQLDGAGSTAGPDPESVDPFALAAATSAATWQCTLAQHPRRTALRRSGPAPVEFDEPSTGPAVPRPDTGDRSDAPRPIPGFGGGPGQNPRAQISGVLATNDTGDSYQVPLRAGEVLGATVRGAAAELEIRDPSGTLLEGSGTDRSGIYPDASPLPGGGNATIDHVASVTGVHTITVRRGTPDATQPGVGTLPGVGAPTGSGTGAGDAAPSAGGSAPPAGQYLATVGIFQPPEVGTQQIFLEFAGATIDTRKFGVDNGSPQPRSLSPLSSFLAGWGLTVADEPAVIKIVTATVRQNLVGSGSTAAQVTDSADSPDTFGRPNVSRVVIGGSVKEAGIATVGISESVDPGNFAREETALVLLDRLDGPADQAVSLNHYLRATLSHDTRVEFVARAIGNIASHEAGHFLGSWHTDAASGRHDLMSPGDVVGAFGFGPDGLGGTKDDTVPRFGQDRYAPSEGFTGTEDTRNRTDVGLGGGPNPNSG